MSCKYVSNGKVGNCKNILSCGVEQQQQNGCRGFYEYDGEAAISFFGLHPAPTSSSFLLFADFAAIFVFDEVVMGPGNGFRTRE